MKFKKLLAATMAATMILSSMVSSLVASAASAGTITAGSATACPGKTDTVAVDVTIDLGAGVVAPHNIVKVSLDGYNLTDVTLGEVVYAEGSAEGKVTIDEKNLADGKVLIEAPVDSKAPTVKSIVFTATFADADDTDTAEGTYDIVVDAADMTNVNEDSLELAEVNGSLTVGHAYEAEVTAPTCEAAGYTTYTCACGDTYTAEPVDALGHKFADGICGTCGAEDPNYVPPVVGPVVDSTLVFAAKPSVVYGTASIEMAFRVANTVLAKYADVKMVIVPQKYDTTTLNLVENPTEIIVNKEDMVKAGSTRMQYYFKDLFLYELALDVNYMLRGYDAEGNLVAVSEVFTTSPATWLKENIAASTDPKFKTMATDTLIVCDEVVKSVAVNYPNSDLAAAPSVIEGFDVSAATESISDYNDIDLFTAYDSKFGTASTSTHQVRVSAQTEKVTFVNLRIMDKNKTLDWNKLSVKVTYTSKDSSGEYLREYPFDADDFTWAGRYINVKFDQVGIHDSNKDILFEVTYDGEKVFDYTYSVESYLGANLTGTIGEMNTALMKLGQSFRAYQNL